MTTVSELRSKVGRMLGDADLEGYDDDLFYDAIGAALNAIMPWTPKTQVSTITGDGNSVYTLPDDLYMVEACVDDDTGELIPHSIFVPGQFWGKNRVEDNNWIEYPHHSLSFSKALLTGKTYSLYYLAYWEKPIDEDNDDDDLEPPAHTHVGLTLYSTAYMMYPSAISAAEVRQFDTKVASGHPEHNPMQKAANYLIMLFIDEMNRHPKHQKAQR